MTRHKGADADGWIALVGQILAGVPLLPGAACLGRSELFDEPEPDDEPALISYRHRAAEKICATCPARAACTEWTATTKRSTVAGHLPGRGQPSPARKARPRKRDAA
ncbi:hypothetical protein [Jongsikchunia kroppenstedtii]|uniref:hypothetical protein n=1 Tax=Jongsikchunia kroppenstedtii TaxID=1121721 RepID=UPI00036BAFFE|nr:hypothetical protein [Jongsikchunia kroppenstedtii]